MTLPKTLTQCKDNLDFFLFLHSCRSDEPNPELFEKAAEELADLRLELTEAKKLLQRFMDEQDSDWFVECGDDKPTELFDTEVPIGLIRDIDAWLKGGDK